MSKISKIKDYIENNAILKRIMNGIIMGVGGAVISKVLLTLFNIILARVLTVEAYGAYSLINNTVQTFTIFAGAGIGVTLTRYVALYREKDNKLAGVLIGTLLLINVLTSMLISILVFIFADKSVFYDVGQSFYFRSDSCNYVNHYKYWTSLYDIIVYYVFHVLCTEDWKEWI